MPSGKRLTHKTIRLTGYDYASAGAYFVTICSFQREKKFGTIVNGRVILSEIGQVIELEWNNLPDRFPKIGLGEFVIMPNHIHGIITLYAGNQAELGSIFGAFKSLSIKHSPIQINYRLWQHSYYERIIRNEQEFAAIEEYILMNPKNWLGDEYTS